MREARLIVTACVLVLSAPAAGQEAAPVPPPPGQASYQRYCGGCHGLDARGTAVTPEIDLTRLGEKYGRPVARPPLLDRVGAHPPLHADWTGDTRVCGQGFLRNLRPGPGAQLLRRGTAREILRYLDTLQVDPATPASR